MCTDLHSLFHLMNAFCGIRIFFARIEALFVLEKSFLRFLHSLLLSRELNLARGGMRAQIRIGNCTTMPGTPTSPSHLFLFLHIAEAICRYTELKGHACMCKYG